jgi:hypothetical protein
MLASNNFRKPPHRFIRIHFGAGSADVTAAVAAQVKKGRLNLVVNNRNLGRDPGSNHVKQLRAESALALSQASVLVCAFAGTKMSLD